MSLIYQATCSDCGKDIDLVDWHIAKDGDVTVKVEPCQDCIETEKAKSFEEGKKEGL